MTGALSSRVGAAVAGGASMLLLIAGLAHEGRAHAGAQRRAAPERSLVVPIVSGPIVVDGELADTSWPLAARTGAFTGADGAVGEALLGGALLA